MIGAAAGCQAAPDRKAGASGATQVARKPALGPVSIPKDALTPEMFGAKGDGTTNDSAAFTKLAEAIARRGGGTIALRRKTYIVGAQQRDPSGAAGYAYLPARLLAFVGLKDALTIIGNGATLRCEPGLRFGTFSAATGEPTHRPMPNFQAAERATPYEYMILVQECAGPVSISDLELDGNLPKLRLGGPYGDTGIQIAGSGIFLRNNRSSETLRGIHAHHHPQDGIMIDGIDGPATRVTRNVEDVRSEYNGRQGCSLVGGHGWRFRRCAFNHTGKAGLGSAPGAGFDIEAEGGKTIRDVVFEDCEFVDNMGCGMVADSGDSQDVRFLRCRFVGTTMWSVWPHKPFFRFDGCTITGTAVNCYTDEDPRKAAQFYDCTFTDDPKMSPNGKVYRQDRADGSLADLSEGTNVLFSRCRFLAVGGAVLPWSQRAIYSDCVMRQTSRSTGYPRGTYIGTNVIDGHVDLYAARIRGKLTVNGKPYTG